MSDAISRRNILQLAIAPALLARLRSQVQDLAPTVSKIYPGPGGALVYVADEQGNTIHDASHAGYGGGGVPIPTVAVKETIWPVAGDNSEHVQGAIDKVSALPIDKYGFRGAVLLRAGYYRMATALTIKASGVVVRGEGMGDTGTILVGTGTGRPAAAVGPVNPPPAPVAAPAGAAGAPPPGGRAGGPGGAGAAQAGRAGGAGRGGGAGFGGGPATLLRVAGAAGLVPKEETKQSIVDEYVPVGSRSFKVATARGFRPGDAVIVRRIGNQAWIDELGMNTDAPGGRWQPFNIDWDRVVTDVQGNTITVDAPILCAIEKRWGGGEIVKYDDPGRIEHIGIENLRAVSEFDPSVRTTSYGNMDRENYVAEESYSDENHYSNFVTFDNLKHGWVRNATALHFGTSMVGTNAGSKWITVQDCVSREPISQRRGGRRFTFALRGQLALVQRCLSDKGRHSFMMGRPTGSGNVYLDCKATNPYSSSEPHENWANGGVYDNVQAPLTARFWKNINIGWAGANTVFWNCEGSFLVQKPPTAQNYTFGHIGVNSVVFNIPLQDTTKPNGHLESLDRHVTPRSLYLTQLRERLGEAAVRNVAAPSQLG